MPQLCEACEHNAAERVESCDNSAEPYHVCTACCHRLHALALRPLEWFNLAKRHGWWQFFLHDDFYDEDGKACQPKEPMEHPDDFPAPTLKDVKHDPQMLLDYSITRWHFDENLAATWASFSRQNVLKVLSERFGSTSNLEIRSRVLEICGSALREFGTDFVRYVWGEYPATISLPMLAKASASCLPFREGFDRVTAALAQEKGSRKRDLMLSLGYFHSHEALDWIEENISEPITESWGNLAAASKLDWPRMESWFEQGRPLSLAAIDALAAIVRPRTPFLRFYGPRLHQPPNPDRLRQVLSAYTQQDPVPRVQQRISALIPHIDTLTKRG
jgi:hypothetical protein